MTIPIFFIFLNAVKSIKVRAAFSAERTMFWEDRTKLSSLNMYSIACVESIKTYV